MIEKRSLSQVQFGYLPEQTVDVKGGIWKVVQWSGAIMRQNIDERSLKRELCRIVTPWAVAGTDGGLFVDLDRRGVSLVVKSLNKDRGAHLKPFPEIWYCSNCFRIHDTPDGACPCQSKRRKGQLQFVAYSKTTGELREPNIPRCPQHQASRIHLPGTATGSEVTFDCPECGRQMGGFGFTRANNGDRMDINVHRAAAVFTPRNVVVVNPPSLEKMRALQDAGGGTRALEWIADGMRGRSMLEGRATADSLRKTLASSGFDAETIERMIAAATGGSGAQPTSDFAGVDVEVRAHAEDEAMTIALGLSESRMTIEEMAGDVDPLSESAHRYRVRYPEALADAGIERVELVDRFPILSGHFGYTRGPSEPGASELIAYRNNRGTYEIYGEIAETEALFIGLDPRFVAKWLHKRGLAVAGDHADAKAARIAILKAIRNTDPASDPVMEAVVKLVHSYAHRLIRLTAVHAGIELHALSELLVPLHFGFFVYAAARGDFVLGGLQALFENDLANLLHEFVDGEHRCALDPGCSKSGGACVACLHLGEPSCRLFNGQLDRHTLAGPHGYLTRTREES
jgi:hypothetical protein